MLSDGQNRWEIMGELYCFPAGLPSWNAISNGLDAATNSLPTSSSVFFTTSGLSNTVLMLLKLFSRTNGLVTSSSSTRWLRTTHPRRAARRTAYRRSSRRNKNRRELGQPGARNYHASYWVQFRVLMCRFLLCYWRSPTYNFARMFVSVFIALVAL